MRPIIVATWSKEEERPCPPPSSPPAVYTSPKSSPPSVCFRRRPVSTKLRARETKRGDAEEKANVEKSGREQIAEQTQLLKSINDNLTAMKELAERNAATNAAVLVLLTHVLKGDTLENGDRDAATTLLPNSNQESAEKIPTTADSDSKSLASDTDIPDKVECDDTDI